MTGRSYIITALLVIFSGSAFSQSATLQVRKEASGKFRLYDGLTGKPFNDIMWDSVRTFHENLAAVKKDSKWGFINEKGAVVIPVKYDAAGNFSGNRALVCQGDHCDLIDRDGIVLSPASRQPATSTRKKPENISVNMLSSRTAAVANVPCPPNIDFENGNFQNWRTNVGTTFNSGGVNILNLPNGTWLNNTNTPGRQVLQDRMGTVPALDAYGGFPVNPPFGGGRYALKLGNDENLGNCSGSPCPDSRAEGARYVINVPAVATDYSVTFSYAVVLENPLSGVNLHLGHEQPRFKVTMYDPVVGDTIDCANFTFVASGPLPGFDTSLTQRTADAIVKFKDWSSVYVNLSRYAGRTLYLDFTTGDCTRRGHFGYAYVDVMECGIGATALYKCAPSATTLTGPPGFETYQWYDNTYSNLVGTGQVITVAPNPAIGTKYWVIATPYGNTGCPTCNCKDTVGVDVLPDYPLADAGPPKEVCPGRSIQIGTPAQAGMSYQWQAAPGLTNSNQAIATVAPAASSSYYLTVTNTQTGCTAIDSVDVVLQPKPVPDFSVPIVAQCLQDNNFSFLNATSDAVSYQWFFGDGNNSIGQNSFHVYTTAGSYPVKLIATHLNGCSDSITKPVTVFPKPVLAFNISNDSVCLQNNNIQFTNTNGMPAGSFSSLWYFGDNSSSTDPDPTHTYLNSGTFQVKLVITTPNGCKDSLSKPVYVENVTMPLLAVTNPAQCFSNNLFTFQFTGTPVVPTAFEWNFGDGNVSTGMSTTHSYAAAGNYPISLRTTTPLGCTAAMNYAVNVYSQPQISFDPDDATQCLTGNVFNFTNASQLPGGILTYKWEFGDGNTSLLKDPSHSYLSAGNYVVKLIATTDKGCKDSITQSVTVHPKPQADFIINTIAQCVNTNNFQFTNSSVAGAGSLSHTWNFGDGGLSNLPNPSHSFTNPGNQTIKLVITTSNGCTDSVSKPVVIHPKPQPAFTINQPTQCLTGNNINLVNTSSISSGINTIAWNFGDGNSSTANNPSHSYSLSGVYNVKLLTTSNFGCKDSITSPVTIVAHPVLNITGSKNVNLCRGDSVRLGVTGAVNYTWGPNIALSCTNCPDPFAFPLSGPVSYTVTGRNSTGCATNDSVRVNVIQPFDIVTNGAEICQTKSTSLLASGAVTYLWSPATGLDNANVANPVATPLITTNYRVVGFDSYNCFTDTAYALVTVRLNPVIDLGADLNLATGTVHPLTSNVQNGPVTSWNWSPATNLSCTGCPLPLATIKNDVAYTVSVTNIYGCKSEDNIVIKSFCQNTQFFIPNAFTPDGDGINDILTIQAKGISRIKSFRIFNRWGELIFEKQNFVPNDPSHSWDGKIRGQVGPPDVFVYIAEVVCENGTSFMYKGNVSILK